MAVRRMAIGWVDMARHCIACGTPAPAEPHQHELPEAASGLREKAAAHAAIAARLRSEADEIDARIKVAKTPAWLCDAHRKHLHDPVLTAGWVVGRHDAGDRAFVERTVEYVQHPDHQPGKAGACAVCAPGSRHRDEVVPA